MAAAKKRNQGVTPSDAARSLAQSAGPKPQWPVGHRCARETLSADRVGRECDRSNEPTGRSRQTAVGSDGRHGSVSQGTRAAGSVAGPGVSGSLRKKSLSRPPFAAIALDRWTSEGRDQIVVVGMETHVCVQQTVLDLLAEGLRPFVVADAVAARHRCDHEVALCRIRDSGATITTVESVMFEWLGSADRPEFKAVSKIIKS